MTYQNVSEERRLTLVSIVRGITFVIGCLVAGHAVAEDRAYPPSTVVYDVTSSSARDLANILDRISLLQNIYGSDPFEASIVVVLHEGVVSLFSRSRNPELSELMIRARSLTAAEVIHFRMCRASARLQGYVDEDFPDFVTMVSMADAEIVRLQKEGYAYMR